MSWTFTQSVNTSGFGFFAVQVWNTGTMTYAIPGDPSSAVVDIEPAQTQDITFFRDVPIQIDTLEFSDPFGDATATFRLPQCTGFDKAEGDTWWLKEFTNIDVLWVPCSTTPIGTGERTVIHPLTQQKTLYAHTSLATHVWEGFIVSIDPSIEGVSVQCLGALRQLDNYYARPLNPLKPKFIETYIYRYMDPRRHGIWTLPLKIEWPDDWDIQYTEAKKKEYKALGPRYVPSEKVLNQNWTGFITRNSGSWQPILTGYINEQLSILYAKPDSTNPLLSKGDQWTITNTPGRQPVMKVRRANAEPTLVAWYGQPGVDARLNRDGTQSYNVVFGKGSGPTGESAYENRWYPGGPWSTYKPLYAKDETWVGDRTGFPIVDLYDGYDAAYERNNGVTVRERYVGNFPEGVLFGDAQKIAQNWVEKDSDPGWTGEITLQVDLRDPLGNPKSKWLIRDGDIIVLKGFQGTGNTVVPGVNKFHITRVTLSPMSGTVTLQVDTKFRDQLTVEEAIQRGRDTLSPIKSLIVNRASMRIEDSIVPWDNHAGSGRAPVYSKDLPFTDLNFPYLGEAGNPATVASIGTRTTGYRPKDIFKPAWRGSGNGRPVQGDDYASNPEDETNQTVWLRTTANSDPFYIPVHAGANNKSRRWATVPILMSQAGTISLTEFCAYDEDGEPAPIEFHVSFYEQSYVFISSMPYDDSADSPNRGEHAALWPNSFESVNPDTNLPWPVGATSVQTNYMPASPMKIGWGTYERPAGYSPGMKRAGAATDRTPTGYLVDGASWQFNFIGIPGGISANGLAPDAKPLSPSNVSGCIAIYAQIPQFNTVVNGVTMTPAQMQAKYEWVYFMGRFYRDIPTV